MAIIDDKELTLAKASDLRPGCYFYRKNGNNDYSLVILNFNENDMPTIRKIIKNLSEDNRIYLSRENPGQPYSENKK